MDLLSINQGMFFWSVIVFLIMVLILGKYAWRPILAAIDERENNINKAAADAEKAKNEAESLLEKHKEMITRSEDESTEILKKAKDLANKHIENAKDEAKVQVKDMIEKAEKAIEQSKESAMQDLRSEFTSLVVAATNKLISANLDQKKHESLVDDYIKKLPKQAN